MTDTTEVMRDGGELRTNGCVGQRASRWVPGQVVLLECLLISTCKLSGDSTGAWKSFTARLPAV